MPSLDDLLTPITCGVLTTDHEDRKSPDGPASASSAGAEGRAAVAAVVHTGRLVPL